MSKVPIPILTTEKSYERYKTELNCWLKLSSLEKSKQGLAVALSLPDAHPSKIKDTVFTQLTVDELSADKGIEELIKLFDKHLGKDSLSDAFDKFNDFERFTRSTESINEFIGEFDNRYQRLEKLGIKLPAEILAFKLLNQINITAEEQMLVKSGIDYSDKDKMYEQTKTSLKKFKGDSMGSTHHDLNAAIKVEPVFHTSTRGRYLHTRGRPWYRARGANYRGGVSVGASAPVATTSGKYPGNDYSRGRGRTQRPLNPPGLDGKLLRCSACGSYRHLIKNCPDSWENSTCQQTYQTDDTHDYQDLHYPDSWDNVAYMTEGFIDEHSPIPEVDTTEDLCLYTGHNPRDLQVFTTEAMNCAVLDSACSSTVCGRRWLEGYLDSLNDHQLEQIKSSDSDKVFRFGGGTRLLSKGQYELPATLAGEKVKIKTDVVSSDIPLLLSKTAMKKAHMKLDLVNDTAEILGKNVSLNCTSSGHYCVPISQEEMAYATDLSLISDKERTQVLRKLHCQFGHASQDKLIGLLKDAQVWDSTYNKSLQEVIEQCEHCKCFSRTPPRSKVALPLAKCFNDVVCVDLKHWSKGHILHIIDMWSRYSVSVFVRSKQPKEIVDKIMAKWISIFGVMNGLMSDNGGEFTGDELKEVASILDVKLYTTAGYSPHQNGLCERVHGVIDHILLKLKSQYPSVDLNILLGWANMAKNSLHSHHGFSSHQLVFGVNPNLPNILTANPPALEGKTMSQVFAKHLNALHSAREAFIKSEASEKVRRALRHKMSCVEQHYNQGENVYYKKHDHERWLGPAKVLAQDGKIIFLRHGSSILRVPPNRVMRGVKTNIPVSNQPDMSTKPVSIQTTHDNQRLGTPEKQGRIHQSTDMIIWDDSDESDEDPRNPAHQQSTPEANEDISDAEEQSPDNSEEHQVVNEETLDHSSSTGDYENHDIQRQENPSLGAEDQVRRSLRLINREHEWDVYSVQVPKTQQSDPKCLAAKKEELKKLCDFEVYQEMEYCGQPCITTRWVITKKGENFRARLVARGFQEEDEIRADSPTAGKSSIRLCLAVAAANQWKLKTTDIKSAFLQSDHLERDVFIIPPLEAENPGKVWKLNKGLYGLSDGARQFHLSLAAELVRLGCEQSRLDHTLYYKLNALGTLQGLILTHMDDFLHCGQPGEKGFHEEVILPLTQRFMVGRQAENTFKYVGMEISQNELFEVTVHQNTYTESIAMPQVARQKHVDLSPEEYTEFRSLVGAINWLVCGTRPDLSYDVVEHSCKFKHATKEDLF